jgi:hypothetical protein
VPKALTTGGGCRRASPVPFKTYQRTCSALRKLHSPPGGQGSSGGRSVGSGGAAAGNGAHGRGVSTGGGVTVSLTAAALIVAAASVINVAAGSDSDAAAAAAAATAESSGEGLVATSVSGDAVTFTAAVLGLSKRQMKIQSGASAREFYRLHWATSAVLFLSCCG